MSEDTPLEETPARVVAIDLVRAVTMTLMIFVNDLWTVKDAPEWLDHVKSGVDGLGLADTVFPGFLFIVGLSLPFAIGARKAKGDGVPKLLWHVLLRAFALVVMGLWMMNGEELDTKASHIMSWQWDLLMCSAFILIWNIYPKTWAGWIKWSLRGLGVLILAGLFAIYHGQETGFAPHWWGILGIIGWAYFLSGSVAVLAHGRVWLLAIAWAALAGLSMANAAHLVPGAFDVLPSPLRDGTHAGLVMGGVLTGTLFERFVRKGDNRGMAITFVAMAAGWLLLAQLTRPLWGISKIDATPAWLFICSATTILAFLVLYWIGDVWKQAKWFALIKPAGSDTLLTYLTPYFVYVFLGFLYYQLPDAVTTSPIGLFKTFLFALFCIGVAGVASRWVKLKI